MTTTGETVPTRRRLIAVVAATPAGVIGRDGGMPWRLSRDLKRFKRTTMGGILVMGRKTFDSIGTALPGRRTIVITRQGDWKHEGVLVAGSPAAAVQMADQITAPGDLSVAAASQASVDASATAPAFVIGGAEIYRQLLPDCDELWLTKVWSGVTGDTILPITWEAWRPTESMRFPAGKKDSVPSEFVRLVARAGESNGGE